MPTEVPVEVGITTVEFSGGWRQTLRKHPRFALYGGGGVIVANYDEKSSFAQSGDDSTLGYTGYSLFGGMEVTVWKYVIAGVEGQFKSVADALGEAGLSEGLRRGQSRRRRDQGHGRGQVYEEEVTGQGRRQKAEGRRKVRRRKVGEAAEPGRPAPASCFRASVFLPPFAFCLLPCA